MECAVKSVPSVLTPQTERIYLCWLEPIDNDTAALGAWRLTDVLDNLRDDTPPDQVRQMLPYYYKKSQG